VRQRPGDAHVTLAERLSKQSGLSVGLPCKVGSLLSGNHLSKEDRDKLAEVLEIPYGTPGRLPNTAIAAALREEGLDIGDAAVTKHRRGACRCFGSNPKLNA
jgi:hypothetical protein